MVDDDRRLADLATWITPIDGELLCEEADAYLRAHPAIRTVVAEIGGGRLGWITRLDFYTRLTGELGYGWSINAQRPLRTLLNPDLELVDAEVSTTAFGQALLDKGGAGAVEEVLVLGRDARIGAVQVRDVFVELGSMLRRQSIALDRLATTDDLTGLANRYGINRVITTAIAAREQPDRDGGAEIAAAVVFMDLDRFKAVNDLYGHSVGDDVLREFARRLRAIVGADDVVGRLGGDEFIAVCRGADSYERATAVAGQIAMAGRRPFLVPDGSVDVSASIGVVVAVAGDSVDETLRNADLAMYHAKARGTGLVHQLRAGERAEALRSAQLETRLPRALTAREIVAHYQPIFALGDRAVVGFEALARWELDGEMVPPTEFVAVAERLGLMGQLTELMIGYASRDVQRLRERPEFSASWVSVNVSARHASTAQFVDQVRDAIARHGLPARTLVVEVTETVMFERIDLIRTRLEALIDMGVVVMLDDFGAGYSSLSPLTDLPLSGVKVDRSIVSRAQKSEKLRTVLRAVFEFANVHALETVAEGLESDGDIDLVRRLGCGLGQGFVVGRPSPIDAILAEPTGIARAALLSVSG